MKVVGLAGRAGSGKSAVARRLAQRPGVAWIDLDVIAWSAYAPGTAGYRRLVDLWGDEILRRGGEIDRARLAERVFADPEALEALHAIVHPIVSEAVTQAVREHRSRGTELLLVEGALLASSGHVDRSAYDRIIWLEASDEVRAARLAACGREEHLHRGERVVPQGEVLRIPADGTVDEVAGQVARAVERSGA
jgi:dephospho-CoA kinase